MKRPVEEEKSISPQAAAAPWPPRAKLQNAYLPSTVKPGELKLALGATASPAVSMTSIRLATTSLIGLLFGECGWLIRVADPVPCMGFPRVAPRIVILRLATNSELIASV
jgi:hypothetical protein